MQPKKKKSLSDKFGMLGLETYFLEVSAHTFLKAPTKSSENLAFLGYFSKEKTEEYD